MKTRARWKRFAALAAILPLPGCLLGGDYAGGGRTIELPGRDAAGGALGTTITVLDAGSAPPSQAASDGGSFDD
jgi:hypothetical protein